VPVIHTAADLGSLAAPVRAHYDRQLGPSGWKNRERAVEKLWDSIRQKLAALHLDYKEVLIYQDGLPVCQHEMEIVGELARAGSRNHQLILEMIDKGAVLVGSEDPQLLIREYEMQRRQLDRTRGGEAGSFSPEEAAELLRQRDGFIARRIAETLGESQTGLLFLGAAHNLDALRAQNIRVDPL
jgi:hypothetical protein